MKIIYFTDLHATHKCPVSRREGTSWLDTQMAKLHEVGDIARAYKVDLVLFGGDLLDRSEPNPLVVSRILTEFDTYPCDVHAIYGNHDYQGSGANTIEHTWLGICSRLMGSTGRLVYPEATCVQRGGITTTSNNEVFITYSSHYKGIEQDLADSSIYNHRANPKDFSILLAHAQITPEPVLWNHIVMDDVVGAYNIVLCSDYHTQWGIKRGKNGQVFIAPGALSRMSRGHDDTTRIPSVAYIDTVEQDVELIPLKCAVPMEAAFDIQQIEDKVEERKHLDTLMQQIAVCGFTSADPIDMLETMSNVENVSQEVKDRAITAVQESMNRKGANG